ncbi:unnamed protein product [Microthlaspi erraticum]|uniref:Uncharacterized protein n=1 Tax=Microthlaspi erraticum TaxID=1685480 RepID=A0A6D2J2Y7_9BRAS|nr:unnamed protein product [Microthlaspi erraticum]
MPLEVCNLDKPFRRYHVCTEDWSTAGRTHSAGQEGNWLRSAFTRTDRRRLGRARPHITSTSRPASIREAMDRARPIHHDPAQIITSRPADPDGRPHPLHGRPDVREQEAHLCSFDFLSPFNLNRLVKT